MKNFIFLTFIVFVFSNFYGCGLKNSTSSSFMEVSMRSEFLSGPALPGCTGTCATGATCKNTTLGYRCALPNLALCNAAQKTCGATAPLCTCIGDTNMNCDCAVEIIGTCTYNSNRDVITCTSLADTCCGDESSCVSDSNGGFICGQKKGVCTATGATTNCDSVDANCCPSGGKCVYQSLTSREMICAAPVGTCSAAPSSMALTTCSGAGANCCPFGTMCVSDGSSVGFACRPQPKYCTASCTSTQRCDCSGATCACKDLAPVCPTACPDGQSCTCSGSACACTFPVLTCTPACTGTDTCKCDGTTCSCMSASSVCMNIGGGIISETTCTTNMGCRCSGASCTCHNNYPTYASGVCESLQDPIRTDGGFRCTTLPTNCSPSCQNGQVCTANKIAGTTNYNYECSTLVPQLCLQTCADGETCACDGVDCKCTTPFRKCPTSCPTGTACFCNKDGCKCTRSVPTCTGTQPADQTCECTLANDGSVTCAYKKAVKKCTPECSSGSECLCDGDDCNCVLPSPFCTASCGATQSCVKIYQSSTGETFKSGPNRCSTNFASCTSPSKCQDDTSCVVDSGANKCKEVLVGNCAPIPNTQIISCSGESANCCPSGKSCVCTNGKCICQEPECLKDNQTRFSNCGKGSLCMIDHQGYGCKCVEGDVINVPDNNCEEICDDNTRLECKTSQLGKVADYIRKTAKSAIVLKKHPQEKLEIV